MLSDLLIEQFGMLPADPIEPCVDGVRVAPSTRQRSFVEIILAPVNGSALCLLVLVLTLGLPFTSAQCSQAIEPQAASSAQPSALPQSDPSAVASGASSSSSGVASEVRFGTGSAITVLENTPLQVVTDVPISSRTAKAGERFPFTVTRDVVVDGVLAIPCGARVYGTVVAAKQAGRLMGSSNLTLELTALNLKGKTYPLFTPQFKVVGQSKTKPTTKKVVTGAAVGAAVEWAGQLPPTYPRNLFSESERLKSDAIVAGMGAGVGTAIAASSPPSVALIPAESQLEFTLATPVAVVPVDQPTALRLARGMFPGGPVLYVRGDAP